MKTKITSFFIIILTVLSINSKAQQEDMAANTTPSVYSVTKLVGAMKIDGEWDKPQWKGVDPIKITHFMGEVPTFVPNAQVKMMYDDENVYVIFRVQDRYVRNITKDIGGPVYKDSAVEFFFSPDTDHPLTYFNLEVNCGGTPLLGFRSEERRRPSIDDIKKIEIAHSLPQITDPEITGPVTWTIEYKIPLEMLENYTAITRPKQGVTWRANFYKIAEITSNPHYMTWSVVKNDKPNFHMPQFFGTLKFQ